MRGPLAASIVNEGSAGHRAPQVFESGHPSAQTLAPVTVDLPHPIAQALGPLVEALDGIHFLPTRVEQSAVFGDFSVVFARGLVSFSITRDRGQFQVAGAERGALEAAGLGRSFYGPRLIVAPLMAWLQSRGAG